MGRCLKLLMLMGVLALAAGSAYATTQTLADLIKANTSGQQTVYFDFSDYDSGTLYTGLTSGTAYTSGTNGVQDRTGTGLTSMPWYNPTTGKPPAKPYRQAGSVDGSGKPLGPTDAKGNVLWDSFGIATLTDTYVGTNKANPFWKSGDDSIHAYAIFWGEQDQSVYQNTDPFAPRQDIQGSHMQVALFEWDTSTGAAPDWNTLVANGPQGFDINNTGWATGLGDSTTNPGFKGLTNGGGKLILGGSSIVDIPTNAANPYEDRKSVV
jgi:hypothetical protein